VVVLELLSLLFCVFPGQDLTVLLILLFDSCCLTSVVTLTNDSMFRTIFHARTQFHTTPGIPASIYIQGGPKVFVQL
jgi:hypothetical protein